MQHLVHFMCRLWAAVVHEQAAFFEHQDLIGFEQVVHVVGDDNNGSGFRKLFEVRPD